MTGPSAWGGLLVASLLLSGCMGSDGPPSAATPAASASPSVITSPDPSATPSTAPTPGCAQRTLTSMTSAERVGQLVMLGVDVGTDPSSAVRLVAAEHLGGVTYIGRSYEGVTAVRAISDRLQRVADLPLLVATDQEGGQVQVLHGPGFSEIPSALEQGEMSTKTLQDEATSWGEQLRRAGVRMDLAPVLDVVPAALGTANQPIGRYHRQYGSTPGRVSTHGLAFARGMQAADVAPVAKHFPGLGSVRGNTDVIPDVTDTVTSPSSPSIQPFRDAVEAGVPVVMVSSAIYRLIDPERPAMFSAAVIDELLRTDLGFRGVVISDDLGAAASAAAYGPVGERARAFIDAGGDIALTVDPTTVAPIVTALSTRVADDQSFAARVDESALRVLELKQQSGLLPCRD